ncbi:MAG TPA: hypothetical protein VF377_11730 [Acidimicrobiia bacterium]|jgi:uncharacterized protein (DUF2336 family)
MDQIDFSRIPLHVRRATAHRTDTSPHVLDLLAGDPDPDVRMAVAANPATPPDALQRLAADSVSRVAARAGIGLAVCHMLTYFTNERSFV